LLRKYINHLQGVWKTRSKEPKVFQITNSGQRFNVRLEVQCPYFDNELNLVEKPGDFSSSDLLFFFFQAHEATKLFTENSPWILAPFPVSVTSNDNKASCNPDTTDLISVILMKPFPGFI
jgi:hypothetical protein